MIRKAFVMKLYQGKEEEYRHRHNPVWPDLADVLITHGVHNYSIHLDDETGLLFAYAEIEDEERWRSIADTQVCREWWASIAPLMETNPDSSPAARDLREMFHMV